MPDTDANGAPVPPNPGYAVILAFGGAIMPQHRKLQLGAALTAVDDPISGTTILDVFGHVASAITSLTAAGDVTATGPGDVPATIGNGKVTYAKIQNVAANSVLGNPTGSAAAPTEISATAAGRAMLGAANAAAQAALLAASFAPVASSGSAADLTTGALAAARLPAFTGDVTSPLGSSVNTLVNIPTGVTMAGALLVTNIAAPGTPAANKLQVYGDFTAKVLSCKDDAGNVTITARPKTATANLFLTAFGTDGTFTAAHPSTADISGLVAIASSGSATDLTAGTVPAARFPAFTGDVTTSAGAVATTIGANRVTLGMLATLAANSVIGNSTGSTATPTALSATAAGLAMLSAATAAAQAALLTTLAPLASPTFTGTVTLPTTVLGNNIISGAKKVAWNGFVAGGNKTGAAQNLADWTAGDLQKITLTGNCTGTSTFTPSVSGSGRFILFITQDATGSRTIATWPTGIKWITSVVPTLTTTGNAIDIIEFIWDGTNYWGQARLNWG